MTAAGAGATAATSDSDMACSLTDCSCIAAPRKDCNEEMTGDNDEGYRGCQSSTYDGFECQPWSSSGSDNTPGKKPGKGLADGSGNYCR